MQLIQARTSSSTYRTFVRLPIQKFSTFGVAVIAVPPFVVLYMSTVYALIIVLKLRTVKNFFDGVQYGHHLGGVDMAFGERLNQIRKEKGRTAQAMADMLQIGLRSYRAYESGDREPQFENLVKIADFLDVSTDLLLCRDEFLSKHAD